MKPENKPRFNFFGGKGSVARISIVAIIIAVIIVSYYFMLSKRFSSTEETTSVETNELDTCLTQDFVKNYPNSPRDVVRWYNRITKVCYGENPSNGQIDKLCDQLRLLMDNELLANNPKGNQLAGLKMDIAKYKDRKRTIYTTSEGEISDVKYVTAKNGDNLAYVTAAYYVREASSSSTNYQTFCLRRDGQGKYKIVAFQRSDEYGNRVIG